MTDLTDSIAEWRASVEAGLDPLEEGDEPLLAALRAVVPIGQVALRLVGCAKLCGRHLAVLARSLPRQLRSLALDLGGCRELDNLDGLFTGLAGLVALETLSICLDGCGRLARLGGPTGGCRWPLRGLSVKLQHCASLASIEDFGRGLAWLPELRALALDMQGCGALGSADELGRGLVHLGALETLNLDFEGCLRLQSVDELSKGLMHLKRMDSLTLGLTNCQALAQIDELGESVAVLPALRTLLLSHDALRGRGSRTYRSVPEFLEAHHAAVAEVVAAATASEIVEGVQERAQIRSPHGSTAETATGPPDWTPVASSPTLTSLGEAEDMSA